MYVGRTTSSPTIGEFWNLLSSPSLILEVNKFKAFQNLMRLYEQVPHAVVFGVGPGSYSSRGFQTFVQAAPGAEDYTNVVRGYINPIYPSIWAQKFVVPLVFNSTYMFGSWTIDGPYSSYLSLLAEVGVLGFLIYIRIYYVVFKRALASSKKAWKQGNFDLFAVSIACISGIIFLFQMAFLDNWFETSRVTVPLWLLLVPVLKSNSTHS